MDLIGLLLGMVSSPITWPIALLIFVAIALLKGWIIPREQSDALIAQHEKVESGLRDTLGLVREDRDRQLDSLRAERDAWKTAADQANDVSRSVREQNVDLIKRLKVLDHLLSSLRSATGIGEDEGGGKDV